MINLIASNSSSVNSPARLFRSTSAYTSQQQKGTAPRISTGCAAARKGANARLEQESRTQKSHGSRNSRRRVRRAPARFARWHCEMRETALRVRGVGMHDANGAACHTARGTVPAQAQQSPPNNSAEPRPLVRHPHLPVAVSLPCKRSLLIHC